MRLRPCYATAHPRRPFAHAEPGSGALRASGSIPQASSPTIIQWRSHPSAHRGMTINNRTLEPINVSFVDLLKAIRSAQWWGAKGYPVPRECSGPTLAQADEAVPMSPSRSHRSIALWCSAVGTLACPCAFWFRRMARRNHRLWHCEDSLAERHPDGPGDRHTGIHVAEQIKGDAPDGRSDQFSLAVLAYFMLPGRRPFQVPTLETLITHIVKDNPKPFTK